MILEKVLGIVNSSVLQRAEARTRKLRDLFLLDEDLSEADILDRMRKAGIIRESLLGTLYGKYLVRTVNLLTEKHTSITGYYFSRGNDGKLHLTYAG